METILRCLIMFFTKLSTIWSSVLYSYYVIMLITVIISCIVTCIVRFLEIHPRVIFKILCLVSNSLLSWVIILLWWISCVCLCLNVYENSCRFFLDIITYCVREDVPGLIFVLPCSFYWLDNIAWVRTSLRYIFMSVLANSFSLKLSER